MVISNDLYEQWHALIYKIAKKYKDNPYRIEFDDLIQIGSIGFIEGMRSFDNSRGIPLINYLAKCISNAILKEFQLFKYDKRKANYHTASINKSIGDDDATIENMIEDIFINVSEEVETKIMNQYFESMFYKYLDKNKAYIVTSKIIKEKTSKDLSLELNISSEIIDRIYRSSLQTLFNKSKYLRKKYSDYMKVKELQSINFHSKVERAAFKFVLWEG